MPDIDNKQNISISRSSKVSIGDVNNTITYGQSGDDNDDEIAKVFIRLIQKADRLPEGSDKADAQKAIGTLKTEAEKGDKAEEKSIHRWLAFLLEATPDIGQVAIDAFLHPIKGLSTAFQKIAERAKAEREAKKSTGA